MRVQLEKRGVLGAGQVKKGGSLPRHIPILNIYVSTPPGHEVHHEVINWKVRNVQGTSCCQKVDGMDVMTSKRM